MSDDPDDPVRCTKCGSAQVHAGKRGWRLTTGFIGSSKVILTCLKCGHQFGPGPAPPPPPDWSSEIA